jgi:glycosyltransferase involved in cell wall biosynthesis
MEKLPISVFIIAKDEADRIAKPILSVRDWVSEVIVIDSGSADDTVSVSKKLGACVVFNEWQGYGQQKIHGEGLCKHDWILNLDADEEATPELVSNIKAMFEGGVPEHAAYKMKWKMCLYLEDRPPMFAPGSTFIRFYNKSKAGFRNSAVHDSVVVRDGSVGVLKGLVYHRCFKHLEHWCGKINNYSSMQAVDFVNKGRKPSSIRLVFEPIFTFFKSYVLRRYFVYGVDGFVASFLYAYARMIRLAKARELIRARERGLELYD